MTPDSNPLAVAVVLGLVLAYFLYEKLRDFKQSNQRNQQLKKARLSR